MPLWITTIESALSPKAVCNSLREVVRPSRPFLQELQRSFRNEPDGFAFEGSMEERTFTLTRIISHRNSFLPVIRGVVQEREGGSAIRLVMTLHPAVGLFMVLWLSGVAWPLLAPEGESSPQDMFLWGMIGFGVLLVTLPFYYEVAKAKRVIGEKLGAV